eukprot:6224088-Amphidinium_carterae.1
MAALDRRLRAAERSVDIVVDQKWDDLAVPIAQVLDEKGWCVCKPDWRAGVVKNAYEEVRAARKNGRLKLHALPEDRDGTVQTPSAKPLP